MPEAPADNAALFGGGSRYYRKYRPAYPDALFQRILQHVPPPYTSALDIGAGTGLSTAALAATFAQVVAIEPDAGMVAAGSYPAGVDVMTCRAEDAALAHGAFQLVTAGNAFYWADGPVLAGLVSQWLAPGGVFAAYRYDFPHQTGNAGVSRILRAEMENHWDSYRSPRLRDTQYTHRVIRQSGCFSRVLADTIHNEATLDIAALVGFYASTSYGIGYMNSLAHPQAYLHALEQQLRQACPEDSITVDFSLELITAIT